MQNSARTPCNDHPAVRETRKFCEVALNLARVSRVERSQLQAERRCNGLESPKLASARREGCFPENSHALRMRCELFEQLQPFPRYAKLVENKASHIASWPRQTGYIP